MSSVIKFLACIVFLVDSVNSRVVDPRRGLYYFHESKDSLISGRSEPGRARSDNVIRAPVKNEILRPVRPIHAAGLSAAESEAKDLFGLRNEDTLPWAGESGNVAELHVKMPGENEGLVDFEYFDHLVASIDCPEEDSGALTINFKDQVTFLAAAHMWRWVNDKADNHFVFMVGDGDCGTNENRILFERAIHTFDLVVGKATSNGSVARRGSDFTPDLEIPVDFDISGGNIAFNIDGVDVSAKCTTCRASGSFEVDARFGMEWFKLSEAAIELRTSGIEAEAVLDMTLKGDVIDSNMEKSIDLYEFSPGGIAIPGIITIGPVIKVALSAGINSIKGGTTLTLGGTARISESKAMLDFLSEDKTTSEGWELETESEPFKASAFVEAKASVSLDPSLGLEFSVFETGFAASLSAQTPVLAANLKATHANTCTVCDKYQNAVEGSITLGSNIGVALSKMEGGTSHGLWSKTLWSATLPPLAQFCQAIGPQPACPTWSNSTAPVGRRLL